MVLNLCNNLLFTERKCLEKQVIIQNIRRNMLVLRKQVIIQILEDICFMQFKSFKMQNMIFLILNIIHVIFRVWDVIPL